MNLTKKNFIILQAVVLIFLPIISTFIGLYQFVTYSGPNNTGINFSAANYFKNLLIPFYLDIENGFYRPYNLTQLYFSLKIASILTSVVFPICSLIGVSRFHKTGSLRLFQGPLIFVFFIHFFYLCFVFSAPEIDYIQVITSVIKLILTFILLVYLSKQIRIIVGTSDDYQDTFVEQTKGIRFLNSLLDAFIVLHFSFVVISWLKNIFFHINYDSGNGYGYSDNTPLQILILRLSIIVTPLVYYCICEGIFKTTFGKIVTNSAVINQEEEIISFRQGLVRSICRFIPFDALSFLLANRGWHDSVSNTTVVKASYKA
ncbi:RDD family protein [Emticicia sp. 17c]|uniref:RDD family protein n=1 Tax=Emticicia sp. 17c TaxID=3127704 RepID=UPI00301CD46F